MYPLSVDILFSLHSIYISAQRGKQSFSSSFWPVFVMQVVFLEAEAHFKLNAATRISKIKYSNYHHSGFIFLVVLFPSPK
jgi:hypothetical protein